MQQIYMIFSNYMYAIPASMILMFLWLMLQRSRDKECSITIGAAVRNSLFVGILVGFALYFNRASRGVEENMYVGPADF